MMTFGFVPSMIGNLAIGSALVPSMPLFWEASTNIVLAVIAILWPIAGFMILAKVRRRHETLKPAERQPTPRSLESKLDFRRAA